MLIDMLPCKSISNESASGRHTLPPGYWFCTGMEKRKIRRSLPPAEPPPPPLPPKDHGEVQFTDPRRFKFAIICMSCMGKHASLQETRAHLKNCPSGLAVDVLCGHCEFRTSSWPAMCAHLNAPGMQREVACKPEYRLTLPVKPAFRRASLPLQSSVIPTATIAASQPSDRGSLLTWLEPATVSSVSYAR